MKKRIFSVVMAVVIFVTAIFATPRIQKTEAYPTTGTNESWNSSYYSTVEGKGSKSTPGFTSPYAYNLNQTDNEYEMTDQWSVIPFNSCEISQDPMNGNKSLIVDPEASTHGISTVVDTAPSNMKKRDGGTKAYYSKWPDQSDKPQALKNIGMEIHNYNNFDVSEYRYLRFEFYRNDVMLATEQKTANGEDDFYFRIQLDAADDTCIKEFRCNSDFINNTYYDMLLDLNGLTGVVDHIEMHLYNVRRISTDGYSGAYVAFDNFRFVKNTTNTQYFAYKPIEDFATFHSGDNLSGVSKVNYGGSDFSGGAYDISNAAGLYGNAIKITPKSSSYGVRKWYHLAISNSGGVQADEYSYFRLFMKLGSSVPIPKAFMVIFRPEAAYSGSEVKKTSFTLSNYKMPNGWYNITVRCDDVHMNVKSIGITFVDQYDADGDLGLSISNPGSTTENATIYVDNIQFLRYDYEPMTEYPYLAGHYQILEGFETSPDANSNSNILYSAMGYDAIQKGAEYKNGHGYVQWYTTNSSSSNKTKSYSGGTGNMYSPQWQDTVTQGNYGLWWRPNQTGDAHIAYNLSDNSSATDNYVDLSKFTHFSLDMSIRNPNLTSGAHNGPVGLIGDDDSYIISLSDTSSRTVNLRFSLNKYDGYKNIIVSNEWGIYAFPLRGFIPGYGSVETGGAFCSSSGPMRLVFSLGELLEHPGDQATGFDITRVKTLRIYRQGGYNPDSRRVDLFFDNLVAFTPDTILQIENTNADFDLTQRFIYSVQGTDAVTNHVNFEFSIPANSTETIQVPLNGYTITQYPWSWRYAKTKGVKSLWQVALPTENTTHLNANYPTYQNFVKLGYKDLCDNPNLLVQRIIFSQTLTNAQWVNGNGYQRY